MNLFWEFFKFELKFRCKSLSTYVYFLMWFAFSFLSVASENFGPIGYNNGKVLLNGPFAIATYDWFVDSFRLDRHRRDIRHVHPARLPARHLSNPIHETDIEICLPRRTLGRFVRHHGLCVFRPDVWDVPRHFRSVGGSFANWAESSVVVSAAVPFDRRGADLFPGFAFLCGGRAFAQNFCGVSAGRGSVHALYNRDNGIQRHAFTRTVLVRNLRPVGLLLFDDITRYWTVAEKNVLSLSWSPHVAAGVFLYNRLLWLSVGFVSLAAVWVLFPMSVEALTASAQGRRAAKAKQQDEFEARPKRSLVAAQLPRVHQVFGSATTWAQFRSLSRMRISTILHEISFWAITGLLIAFAINNGYFAGRVAEQNVWPVTYLMLQAVEGTLLYSSISSRHCMPRN